MAIQTLPETGAAVRSAMAAQRVSQRSLADALGLTQAGVSRRLSGEVDFTVSEIAVVALVLDVPVSELMPNADSVAPSSPEADGSAARPA